MNNHHNNIHSNFGGYYETKLAEIAARAKELNILNDDIALYNYAVYALGSENFMMEDTLMRIHRLANNGN